MNGTSPQKNGFVVLRDDLKHRFLTPIGHVTFWAYLILGVVVFGGFPVWLELIRYFNSDMSESASLRSALVAFFPALIGSVSFQLVFEEVEKRNKRMMSFALFAVVFFSLISGILIFSRGIPNYIAIPLAFALCGLAVLEWWIANGLNPAFQDDSIEAPVGGPTSQSPSGNLTGYTR